jgi:hypothetical protein
MNLVHRPFFRIYHAHYESVPGVEEYFGQKKAHATAPFQKSHMHTQFGNPQRREDEGKGKENPVVRVVQFGGAFENLSDCGAAPYLRFFLVRNEEAGGSNPLSSTRFSSVGSGNSGASIPEILARSAPAGKISSRLR